jgi:hypothetical protein
MICFNNKNFDLIIKSKFYFSMNIQLKVIENLCEVVHTQNNIFGFSKLLEIKMQKDDNLKSVLS